MAGCVVLQQQQQQQDLQGMNPLAALLHTLAPWVNVGEAPEYEGAEGGGHQGGGQNEEDE